MDKERSKTDLPHPVLSTECINQEIPAPVVAVATESIGAQDDKVQEEAPCAATSQGQTDQLVEGPREETPLVPKENFQKGKRDRPLSQHSAALQEDGQHEVSHLHLDNDSALPDSTDNDSAHHGAFYDHDTTSFSDYDSGEDASSIYTSLLSDATEYYWENGRRYHAHQGGRYPLPNDEVELDREDMKHHEWMLITDFRLHLSPIDANPQRILDIGTGTGIWAMQVAELYPSAEVIGTDISPVQPKWVPPNLTFEFDDLELEWLYKPGTYDLIHVRFMFLAIKDYPAMLAQAYRTLKPGGYIELSELEVNPKATNPGYSQPVQIFRWLEIIREAMKKMGFHMSVAPTFKDLLTDAGFVDVVETRFEVPWGAWPKERRLRAIGFWHIEQLKQGLQGIVMALFTRSLGWTQSEVEVFLVNLRKELDDWSYHMLDHAYVVYGRKPYASSGIDAGSSG